MKTKQELQALISEINRIIEAMENEVVPVEKWEPEGGEYFISDQGLVLFGKSTGGYKSFGMERPTAELAEKHLARLRKFNKLAAYVDQYAPDYEFKVGIANYYVYFDRNSNRWSRCFHSNLNVAGTVYMPKAIADRLLADLDAGVVVL